MTFSRAAASNPLKDPHWGVETESTGPRPWQAGSEAGMDPPVTQGDAIDESEGDRKLLQGFAAGEAACQRILFERYEKRLYALCRRILVNREDAEDALQETFLQATRSAGQFQGKSFGAWMYGIAVNECRTVIRKSSTRRERERRAYEAKIAEGPPDAASECEDRSREAAVAAAMDTLPNEQREVLALKYLDRLKTREVAEILGLPLATVRGRLERGRENLRKELKRRNIR